MFHGPFAETRYTSYAGFPTRVNVIQIDGSPMLLIARDGDADVYAFDAFADAIADGDYRTTETETPADPMGPPAEWLSRHPTTGATVLHVYGRESGLAALQRMTG